MMLEEKDDNLQNAEGNLESQSTNEVEATEAKNEVENTESEEVVETENEVEAEIEATEDETAEVKSENEVETTENETIVETAEVESENEVEAENTENETVVETAEVESEQVADESEQTIEEHQEAVKQVSESVAEDSEDESANKRHEIPVLEYDTMTMEALVVELEKLVQNEKVQAIKDHVDGIKSEFNQKFNEVLEQSKEDFLAEGGNIIDFHFSLPIKGKFNVAYNAYRSKRTDYYKSLEKDLHANLARRLALIEELKGLLNVEENINTTYKQFKKIQEEWRTAGSIPKTQYNNVWRTYHHHVERFYDFLHLNRDLRDLDFKHNYTEKQKIVARAEELAQENDVIHAFRELQNLHRLWKEDIGPVAKELREDIWNKFSAATKSIHDRRQDYFKNIDKVYEQNLVVKEEIIEKINAISTGSYTVHNQWQNKIKEIEKLREEFFKAGKVPIKVNEATWSKFKHAVRDFNANKNTFYKSLKKEQQDNLAKKLALIELAESLKDNDDWNDTTPRMKKVQADWKKVGHVPKKISDKVWKQFKNACNHYFDKLHAQKNEANKEEEEALEKKKALLEAMETLELSGDTKQDIETIKEKIAEWKSIGRVPFSKKNIDNKFNKVIDGLFKKLDIDKQESELIKYSNRLDNLDAEKINSEKIFIRRKTDEISAEIRQLENNLQFFSNSSSNSPMLKKVHQDLDRHKKALETWKGKLDQLRSL
ncbi:hypothetical protein IMCC3317_43870 [Kordia antarctica]|uniref:Uncharacterized protein n=1 Tax=Kordia antarctica TaxID=1218801 RepID=A0A7L4ZR58_9FLAO|nr:DUF349 domain-containing protein [Kordia antarctica]QHI38987.1 hypothetical protein IMCC3317_43870 [Kordia antarctica]